ncbi:hypothetical protein NKI96_16270 [Mesorhizobium sp. M0292]|uniref:hypothetical protein n=1 Tax=Mesorhizobium sp. M0292 TaxID=2956929 RepID=UPI003337AE1A
MLPVAHRGCEQAVDHFQQATEKYQQFVTAKFIGVGRFGGLEYQWECMCRQSIPDSGMRLGHALRPFFLSACRQTKKPGAIGRV